MFDVKAVTGIGEYRTEELDEVQRAEIGGRNEEKIRAYIVPENGKAFVVERLHTVEVRSDKNLIKTLRDKYESVMTSRYFGKNGIEIVMGGQLTMDEIYDLVRLSYNLTREL